MTILDIFLFFFSIILVVVIIKVFSKIVKVVLSVFLVILLVMAVCVFLAGSDYKVLKREYSNSSNLFVFVNNGSVTYVLRTTGFGLVNSSVVSKAERIHLQDWYRESDLESMRADYYRLLILDEVGYGESYKQIINLFKVNNLKTVELGVKDGNIEIYPKTMFFKVLKYVPRPFISLGLIVS